MKNLQIFKTFSQNFCKKSLFFGHIYSGGIYSLADGMSEYKT